MARVNPAWMPACAMKRVICHWTAGGYEASSHDREFYHILIDKDGNLVRGTHSIRDNVSTEDGVYAAHTHLANTGSIGVSLCCMAGAQESPFSAGPCPMTETQWLTMAEVVADLCRSYDIPVTPKTVLGHGEVQANLGKVQNGKWDPMVLPFEPGMSKSQVGNFLRSLVQRHLDGGGAEPAETLAQIRVVIQGRTFTEAILTNEQSFLKIRPAAEAFGWRIDRADGREVALAVGAASHVLPMILVGEDGYVECRGLATALGAPIAWNEATQTVTIG